MHMVGRADRETHMAINTTFLSAAEIAELAEDDRIIGGADMGEGWFYSFESDHGESGLTGPFASQDDAKQAARDVLRELRL